MSGADEFNTQLDPYIGLVKAKQRQWSVVWEQVFQLPDMQGLLDRGSHDQAEGSASWAKVRYASSEGSSTT